MQKPVTPGAVSNLLRRLNALGAGKVSGSDRVDDGTGLFVERVRVVLPTLEKPRYGGAQVVRGEGPPTVRIRAL